MKSCVVTANYACDPNKVWLYLTKPTLNGWRRDVSSYEESDDGLKAAEKNTDGSETQIVFTRKEKPRCLSCNFQKGKISGTFTALLLGGGDADLRRGRGGADPLHHAVSAQLPQCCCGGRAHEQCPGRQPGRRRGG